MQEGIHRGPLYAGPIVYKTYEAGYFALAAEVDVLSGIPAVYGSRTVALGDGSQVVVAVDPTSKVAMLGFSASDTTLQQVYKADRNTQNRCQVRGWSLFTWPY